MPSEEVLRNRGRLGLAQKEAKALAIKADMLRTSLRSHTDRHTRIEDLDEEAASVTLSELIETKMKLVKVQKEIKSLREDLGEA